MIVPCVAQNARSRMAGVWLRECPPHTNTSPSKERSDVQPRSFDTRCRWARDQPARVLKQGGSIVAGGSILGLVGCGGSSRSSSSSAARHHRLRSSPTKNVAIGMTSDLFPAFTQKGPKGQMAPIKRFEAQTGIKVKVVTQSSDTSTYFEKMRTQLQAGAAEVDVFAGDVSWPPQFGSQGWLVDLSGDFAPAERAPFLPASRRNVWNEKIYGVPFYWDDGYLFYRKDLLEKLRVSGPPQTWAELQEMAQKVMKDHNLKYGFTFTGPTTRVGPCSGWSSCGPTAPIRFRETRSR